MEKSWRNPRKKVQNLWGFLGLCLSAVCFVDFSKRKDNKKQNTDITGAIAMVPSSCAIHRMIRVLSVNTERKQDLCQMFPRTLDIAVTLGPLTGVSPMLHVKFAK